LRVLLVVAVVFALAVIAAVAVAATLVRRPLPAHEGTAEVPGLDSEVTVLRDERGVPSIYAETAEDLFRAQGYVHAQDRFFEMDYRRHVTSGRLSELVGENEDALAADQVIRTFGWREVAEEEWWLLEPETQAYLEAYAEGVNAYLHERSPDALGVEYTVLGVQVDVEQPEDWDPVDSLAWLKAMAWDMRGNYDDELDRGLAYATLRDTDLVNELFPTYPANEHATIVSAEDYLAAEALAEEAPAAEDSSAADVPAEDYLDADAPAGEDLAADAPASGTAAAVAAIPNSGDALSDALATVNDALEAVPHLLGEGDGVGSNSWAVSGEHTASGAPILANDPHLSISAPGVWSQMGLYCTHVDAECPFEVSGFTFSGFPGVIIGHNGDLAWGLTNLGADVTDFFLERIDAEKGTYLRDGAQVPLETRTEVIEVNGGDPVTIEVRSTVHGPIVSDVLEVDGLEASPTAQGTRVGVEVSLAWTALQPGRSADAVFALDLAKDAEDVADAAVEFQVPSQNIVYATVDGHIGYQAPGLIPVRARILDGPVPSDGTWPRPGWDSRYDWEGFVDPADMPAVQDPASGYVVAANQAVTPPDVGPYLTSDWDYGYRSDRITTLLDDLIADGTPIDVGMTGDMQNDAWNAYAAVLVPVLVETGEPDAFTQEGIDLLREWDYQQDADSAAAAYFSAVWANVLDLTFRDELPKELWPDGGSRWLRVVDLLLEDPGNPWWDDHRTVSVVESRDEILVRAMETARLQLTVQLGKDASEWQWGRLHTAAPRHAVLGGDGTPAPVRRLVNPSPLAVGGGSSIVNATAWDAATDTFDVTAAPSMRMVVDLADLDASTWVVVTGTSGHPGSVHYTDQFAAWAAGETYAWPFTAAAVQDESPHELTLTPEQD
jgi:penicillin amidase